jgi:hypothetical protein
MQTNSPCVRTTACGGDSKSPRPGLVNLFFFACPNCLINFEEIVSCAHGNFEEQKVLEPSIIIINLLLLMHITVIIN